MKRIMVLALAVLCLLLCVSPAVYAEEEEAPKHPAPLAWYTFDDAEDLGADSSGNGNHLELKGDVKPSTDAVYDGGVYLDGSSALVAVPDENGADFVDVLQDTTKQLTLTYWFKATADDIAGFDANTTWRRIVSNGMVWDGQGGFTFINNPDNMDATNVFYSNPFVEFNDGLLALDQFPANTPYTQEWMFVAVCVDAAACKVDYYVNGILVASLTPSVAGGKEFKFSNLFSNFALGCAYMPGIENPYFQSYKGSLDQFGVFDTVLSEEDIRYVMANLKEQAPDEVDPPSGQFFEGENVVMRFNSIRNICSIISGYNYIDVGQLDRSAKLKIWGDMPLIEVELDLQDVFSLKDYKYMKIKYCCNTANPNTAFLFASTKSSDYAVNDILSFEHQNKVWEEKVFDMSALAGWDGSMLGFQLMPTTLSDDYTESFFIEYIAFFKTEEAANAYGGLTDAQKAGQDPVSLYYSRGYVNPYLDYPVRAEARQPQQGLSLTVILIAAGGTAVIVILTAVITALICKKRRKGGA